jgi:programmed cell death protein 4
MEHKKEEFFKSVANKPTVKQNSHHAAAAAGHRGQAKKGGAGGKGTWGKGGLDDLNVGASALDENDPNYASDDEEVVVRATDVITPHEVLLQEYAASGDADELAKSLKEAIPTSQFSVFVDQSVEYAIERQSFEREFVSQLLLALSQNHTLTTEHIEGGFQAQLDKLEDFVLDNPDAVETLAKFLARAVVDEILPPAFVDKRASSHSKLATEALALAHGLINEPHRVDRLRHIWGPGTFHSVKRMKEEVTTLLEEYLVNGDLSEADKSVRNLHAPSFHFQIVKEAVRLAITKNDGARTKLGSLLAALAKEGLVSTGAIVSGFNAVGLADLSLDEPKAKEYFAAIVNRGKAEGWLPTDYAVAA